jgi:hypothetical protein
MCPRRRQIAGGRNKEQLHQNIVIDMHFNQENKVKLAKAGKKRGLPIAADNDPMEKRGGRKAVISPEMCCFIETSLLANARISDEEMGQMVGRRFHLPRPPPSGWTILCPRKSEQLAAFTASA